MSPLRSCGRCRLVRPLRDRTHWWGGARRGRLRGSVRHRRHGAVKDFLPLSLVLRLGDHLSQPLKLRQSCLLPPALLRCLLRRQRPRRLGRPCHRAGGWSGSRAHKGRLQISLAHAGTRFAILVHQSLLLEHVHARTLTCRPDRRLQFVRRRPPLALWLARLRPAAGTGSSGTAKLPACLGDHRLLHHICHALAHRLFGLRRPDAHKLMLHDAVGCKGAPTSSAGHATVLQRLSDDGRLCRYRRLLLWLCTTRARTARAR
mmetsp:Transcript_43549/g.87163  ORF Transcript_43549/g.87163 Transcript_43549/m.87163 type:complete len:260 (+) Transcript_43549:364-1143(+)